MNNIFRNSIIFILLSLTACEQVDIIEEELPFNSLYVINSQISGNDLNPKIRITKTLPLNESYNDQNADITNAVVYLRAEDNLTHTYVYEDNGFYVPYDEFLVQNNMIYELFINIEGEKIYSISKVPPIPEVANADLKEGQIIVEVVPRQGEVYSAAYVQADIFAGEIIIKIIEDEFFSVEAPDESLSPIFVRTGIVPQGLRNNSSEGTLGVKVFAWDKSFKGYFETKDNNKEIEDLFAQGGGPIKWNIIGDNAIGLFLGYSSVIIPDISE
jgi:hypothetical protein